jgi:hypothetical protein
MLLNLFLILIILHVDEEGIDSGGLSKEAFLLLSKDLAIFAGTLHKNWMVQHNKTQGSGDKQSYADGGLFFTEAKSSEESNIKELRPPIMQRKSSMSILAPLTAMARRSSWRQESGTNGSNIVTNNDLTSPKSSPKPTPKEAGVSEFFGVSHNSSKSIVMKLSSVDTSKQILEDEEHISRDDFFKVRFLGIIDFCIFLLHIGITNL